MTSNRGRASPPRRQRAGRYVRQYDRDPDPYHVKRKVAGPAVCPDCGAVQFRGRWTWRAASANATQHVCPACQRVRDKVPAAYLTLRGEFMRAHEDEIMHLARNFEERERKEHPLKRMMGVEKHADAIVLTFTDAHIARGIAEALHHAYQGEVELQYTKEDVMLRASWTR